jgi:iron-sulfur cluster assembly protein
MQIEISSRAQKELLSMVNEPNEFLRIGIMAGGCAGMTYNAGFDTEITDEDVILFENGGLKVVADMKSALYTQGLGIDYTDDLVHAGFRLINTRAKKSCGCGQSFQA